MSEDERKLVCAKIQESVARFFAKSEATWKLFCDTDGDRRPSLFTKIAYGLCPYAIVPLHANKSDLDRAENMLGIMHQMRSRGEISTQVLFVVWNFVKSIKDEPMEHNGNWLPFTPTKVNIDILSACNTRLCGIRKDLGGLFAYNSDVDRVFVKASTMVLRDLADNVLKPSEELGKPFVQMVDELADSGKKTMKFKSGETEYVAAETVIANTGNLLSELHTALKP